MRDDRGFSLIETVVAVFLSAVMAAIAWPDFRSMYDRGQLDVTSDRLVADLSTAQVVAFDLDKYEEIRFAPFGDYYQIYLDGAGYESFRAFASPTRYFEGYLHLPEPYLRFYGSGGVSESGQIGLVDPEGDVRDIVVSLGFGVLRPYRHMVGGGVA